MKRVAFLVLLTAVAALAQPLPPESPPADSGSYPIRSLAVEGNQLYTEEQTLSASGLEIGMPAGQVVFEQAQRTLLRSGAFETVGFRYSPDASGEGYAVVLEVAEIQQVFPISFMNIEASEEDLRAWLRTAEPLFGDRIPGTRELMARYATHIEAYLESVGTPERIEGELTMDRPGEMYLLFHPIGAVPVVAEVDFTGNEAIPIGTLRRAINGAAVGSRFTDVRFRLLLDSSIRPLYEAQGRVRVAFPAVHSEQAPGDVRGLNITVEVSEGEPYNFGSILVEGTASMNQRLGALAALKSGELANFDQVRAAVERVNLDMRERGYMGVSTEVERNIHDDRKTVDLLLRVEPGPLYTFGKLVVEGLDIHGEAEVRRIWGLEQGVAFRSSYPDFFLKRVQELGVFDNLDETRSQLDVDDNTLTVDVTLLFDPEPERKLPSTFDDPRSGN